MASLLSAGVCAMRTDRIGWDDLYPQRGSDLRRAQWERQRPTSVDADLRRLRKHFWADQAGMQTWFYRRDAREW